MATHYIQQLAQAVFEASLNKKTSELESIADRAIQVLQEKKLLKKSQEFFTALDRARALAESERTVAITTAHDLSVTERNEFKKYFAQYFASKNIKLEEKVRPALLGGFIAESENTVINGSLKQSINDLVKYLKAV